jgi:hypothetical protein
MRSENVVTLTGKVLGSERNVPDSQDDRRNKANDSLSQDHEPSGLEVIGHESPAPNHDYSDCPSGLLSAGDESSGLTDRNSVNLSDRPDPRSVRIGQTFQEQIEICKSAQRSILNIVTYIGTQPGQGH